MTLPPRQSTNDRPWSTGAGPALDTAPSLPSATPSAAPGGEAPVFAEPWQAQAFAMTLELHRRGAFTWPEWARALADEIAAAQAAGDADLGDTYYRHWLAALERLLDAKGLAPAADVGRHREAWAQAAARTPHGQPISLRDDDFGRG